MILTFLVLLLPFLLLPCNGQDLKLINNVKSRIAISGKGFEDYDEMPLLGSLEMLKQRKFYGYLPSKFADIPNLNLNITSECEEDLLLIAVAAVDTNNTSPELAAVLSQSKGYPWDISRMYGKKLDQQNQL